MDAWLTLEVRDGEFRPAAGWRRAYGEALVEAAVTHGVLDWVWHTPRWGVVLELEFPVEEARDRFRHLPAVVAALDAVPDPVAGLMVYPGRGGGAGASVPRRPRPAPSSAAAEVDPPEDRYLDFTEGDLAVVR